MESRAVGIQTPNSKKHQGPKYPALIFEVKFGFTDLTGIN
jgi:hypothetical protein